MNIQWKTTIISVIASFVLVMGAAWITSEKLIAVHDTRLSVIEAEIVKERAIRIQDWQTHKEEINKQWIEQKDENLRIWARINQNEDGIGAAAAISSTNNKILEDMRDDITWIRRWILESASKK